MANEADEQGDNENWDIRFRQDEELEFFTELALHETERWIQTVTRKKFAHPDDFRRSLENGVLLCELLNNLKAGSVKRINKLPGPIAGLDNINVFLQACKSKFGLNDTHLFDVTDLEDLSQRAISESEHELKQEQDRRSRNVAVTIYWLGRSVSGQFSGPQLDTSAYAALVNHHGKDLISSDQFRHDSWESSEQSGVFSSHENSSRGSLRDSLEKRHNRDSSYDSYGSCSNSRESELSFSLEEENMPGISMRRYGSTSSINRSGELQLALNSEDDSLYQSTPELANNSNHARSPSTDSMDGSYHGNHSRQSSDSVDIPTRTLSTTRKVSTSSVDPMQFVKIKASDHMAKKAEAQIKMSQEVKKVRTKIDKEEEDWQSNLSSWKTRRRKQSAAAIERVEETDKLAKEKDDEEEKKAKTYQQMLAERTERRKSTGRLNFYPVDDDEDSLFSSPSPVKESFVSSSVSKVESATRAPALSMKQRSSSTSDSYVHYDDSQKASWADSSSDEESVKTVETKVERVSSRLQEMDPSNRKSTSNIGTGSGVYDNIYNRGKVSDKESTPIQKKLSAWKSESSLMTEKKLQPWKTDKTENSVGSTGNKLNTNKSASKISNLLKSFEQKEEQAKEYKNPRRSYEFKTDANISARPSRLKNAKWNSFETPSGSLTFSAPEKAASVISPRSTITEKTKPVPSKAGVEKTIKICQKPNNDKGFGFTISGGADKRQPITIQKISLGSAADVCEVLQKDEIVTINERDISRLSQAQVQKLIDDAVKVGQIELRVRRPISDDGDFDEDEDNLTAGSPTSQPENLPSALTPRQNRGYSPTPRQSSTPQRSPSEPKTYTPERQYRSHSPRTFSSERPYRVRSPAEGQNTPPTLRRSREVSPVVTSTPSPLQRSYKSPSPITEHRQTLDKKKGQMKDTQLHSDDHLNEDITESNNNDLKNDLITPPSPEEETEPQYEQITAPPQNVELELSRQVVTPVKREPTPVKQEPTPVEEEFIPKVEAPVRQELLPQTLPKHEVEIVQKPVIAVKRDRKSPVTESPISIEIKPKLEVSPNKWDLPPPPPTEEPPTIPGGDDDSNSGPPAILRRWQQKKPRPRSEYTPSSKDLNKDAEKRLSASFLWEMNRDSDDDKQPVVEPVIVQEKKEDNDTAPLFKVPQAMVGQPVTLEIRDDPPHSNQGHPQPVLVTPVFQAGHLQIDPRNQADSSEENLPQYNFHFNINKMSLQSEPKPLSVDTVSIEKEREKIREQELRRVEEEKRQWEEESERKLEEKKAQLLKQEQEIREAEERLRREKERMQREREELEKSRKRQEEVLAPEPKSFHVRQNSPTTHFSTSTTHTDNNRPAPRKLDVSKPMVESLATKDKTRWSREDMLAMNRKATPLQKKPEHETTEDSVSSEVSREAPSKQDLHNLNAVPKPKFRGSMDWMKPEDKELHSSIHNSNAKPVSKTEGSRASPNLHDHWLIEEAERRRKAVSPNRQSATLPQNSSLHIKPNNNVTNRWRDDFSVPKQQTSISLQSNLSQPRTLSTTVNHNSNLDAPKHTYNPTPQSKLSQTLPRNFNSSLAPKRDQPSVPPKPMRNSASLSATSPTSPLNQAEQFMAVSGKQCCSYCDEELGFGAAMVIESLGLYYHVQCFKCCVCHTALGNGSQGTDVRVRVNKLHCRNCYSNDEGSRRRERRANNV